MRQGTRAFGTSAKAALEWIGGTEQEILNQNPGISGENAVKAVKMIAANAEKKACTSLFPVPFQRRKGNKQTKPKLTLSSIQYGPKAATLRIQYVFLKS